MVAGSVHTVMYHVAFGRVTVGSAFVFEDLQTCPADAKQVVAEKGEG